MGHFNNIATRASTDFPPPPPPFFILRDNKVVFVQGCSQGMFTRLLQGCYKVVYKVVTRLLQGCYKVATRLLQGCYKVVTRLLQSCYKVVTMSIAYQ